MKEVSSNVPGMPPHARNSATSREAARQIIPYLKGIALYIYNYIKTKPDGVTADEVEFHFSGRISSNSIRPSLARLETLQLIEKTGRVRPTRTGRQAMIHAIVKRDDDDMITTH